MKSQNIQEIPENSHIRQRNNGIHEKIKVKCRVSSGPTYHSLKNYENSMR